MVHYRPQECDVRELSEQDSVCVCTLQWQWDATDDSDSHVVSCMLTAHSNTAIQLNTCTKLVLNLLSVLSKLISNYAIMQCNEIANHTNIFKWRYKKKHGITSQYFFDKLFWIFFLFQSNYCSHCLFFSSDQVAEGGANAPPPFNPLATAMSRVVFT